MNAQEYISLGENRRRGSIDEDAGDYIYADYDANNGILDREPSPPIDVAPPPRSRVPQAPKRTSPNFNPYNEFRRPSGAGLQGRDACKSGAKSVAHEDTCDLYYECYEGQGFLTSCPNGLVYGGEGRFGLIGLCDYPHNVNCAGREGRSKFDMLMLSMHYCIWWIRNACNFCTFYIRLWLERHSRTIAGTSTDGWQSIILMILN